MEIKTLKQWINSPYEQGKGELSQKEWVKAAQEGYHNNITGLAMHLGVTDTTVRNYARGLYMPKERVRQEIVNYCREPLLFQFKNQHFIVQPQ